MFRMLFYRLSHTHTHTEQARRQAADSGQRTVESRVSPLLAMDCPGAMQSSQGCPELLHTHEHMQVCIGVCVCHSPGVVHAESCLLLSCGQLLSPFCPLASGNIYRTSTLDEQRVANDFNSRLRLLASRIQCTAFDRVSVLPASAPISPKHKAKYIILQIYSINSRKLPLTELPLDWNVSLVCSVLCWSLLLCLGLLGATVLSLFALKLILGVLPAFPFPIRFSNYRSQVVQTNRAVL